MNSSIIKSKRTTITKGEYQQLLGLSVLAARHNERLKEIEGAAIAIVEECNPDGSPVPIHGGGHVWDMVYSERDSVDEMLHKMHITVES